MFQCQSCHQAFDRQDHIVRNPPKYCSRKCRDDGRRAGQAVLTCVQCQAVFRRKPYMRDWSKHRGPFCSMRCYGLWQRLNVRGDRNPAIQRPPKTGAAWNRVRLAALERDGQRCRNCGADGKMNVHHVNGWQPGDPHELDNLMTLCVPCHVQQHHPAA